MTLSARGKFIVCDDRNADGHTGRVCVRQTTDVRQRGAKYAKSRWQSQGISSLRATNRDGCRDAGQKHEPPAALSQSTRTGKMMKATGAGPRNPQADGRTCCLCGGNDFRLLDSWGSEHPRNSASIPVGFWECSCQLAILHPVPETLELPDDGDWWSSKKKFIRRHPRWKRIRKRLSEAMFGTWLERLIRQTRQAQPWGRLLDIGCGTGDLLWEASRYYQCDGLEPSPQAAEHARQRGFRVVVDCLEPARISSATYDVITLCSVLEHVRDPVDVLRKVNRILRPGGIVSVTVPKLWGPSHRRHRREWNGYRVGYHLTMFSGQTMDAVMSAAGLAPLHRPRRDRMLDDILTVWGRKVREAQERDYGEPARFVLRRAAG